MKECTMCNKKKPNVDFYKSSSRLQSRCKTCMKEMCRRSTIKKHKQSDQFYLERGEIFKTCKYSKEYLISNLGRVYRKEHTSNIRHRGMFMKMANTVQGYKSVGISGNRYLLHRVVADHFLHREVNDTHVHHIDHNRSNNKASNLMWCTHEDNIRYASENDSYSRKLTRHDVSFIRSNKDMSRIDLAEKFNVTKENISAVMNKKTWKHIP